MIPKLISRCSLPRVASTAVQFVSLSLALAVSAPRAAAQAPAMPDAPTIPDAPTLPPAAIIKAPLPPAAGQEIIDERPSSQHVWIPGHYRWQEGNYVWVASRWELPPRANVSWVEPHWAQQGNGYALAGGYWQEATPPTMVVEPTTPAPEAPVIVQEAPPPPPREYIVERPSPYHVWIGGFWSWRLGRHVWMSGHWELPPHANVVWVEPRWERRGNGYVLVQGYWQDATPLRVVVGGGPREMVVFGPPPPPRRERHNDRDRPSPRHVWIDGYWAWHDGRNFWVSGHWEMPPRERAMWIAPRWERRGNGYVFIEGVWR